MDPVSVWYNVYSNFIEVYDSNINWQATISAGMLGASLTTFIVSSVKISRAVRSVYDRFYENCGKLRSATPGELEELLKPLVPKERQRYISGILSEKKDDYVAAAALEII